MNKEAVTDKAHRRLAAHGCPGPGPHGHGLGSVRTIAAHDTCAGRSRPGTVAAMPGERSVGPADVGAAGSAHRRPPVRRRGPLWLVLVGGLLLAGGLVALAVAGDDPGAQPKQACEAYVKDLLVAPATARFSGEQFLDTDRPEVTGVVDADNGSGAPARHRFSCQMVWGVNGWQASGGDVS